MHTVVRCVGDQWNVRAVSSQLHVLKCINHATYVQQSTLHYTTLAQNYVVGHSRNCALHVFTREPGTSSS